MKKNIFSSIIAQLILLVFVIVWIIPTFGLFVSSFRDKDVLAISGWWTSFTTTEVNEIYRTKGKEDQIKEGDYYFIKSNLSKFKSDKLFFSVSSNLSPFSEIFFSVS